MTFQTFTGIQYLQIDIASNFGLDKEDWQPRLDWFQQNEHQLEQLVNQAEEPALFYAGVNAYRDVQAGKPIGYMISLDATSSGLQILAALTGDRSAAELCNVVDTGHRMDAYTEIHGAIIQQAGMGAGITRTQAKNAIMTSLYNSTAVPRRVFGDLLPLYIETMETLAPAAWELNQAMPQFWDSTTLSHDWVMPDNFHVRTKVTDVVKETVHIMGDPFEVTYKVNQPTESGLSLGANMTHSIDGMIVREITARCDFDPANIEKLYNALAQSHLFGNETITDDDKLVVTLWDHYTKSGYLSARILDHLNLDNLGHVDAAVIDELLTTLPEKPFKVVSVHDCFRCLPHYGDDLRWQYNLQLAMIASSNLLQYLLTQITGQQITIEKLDPDLWEDVVHTNYALS